MSVAILLLPAFLFAVAPVRAQDAGRADRALPRGRAARLLPGPEFSAVDLPPEVAMHWPSGLYYDVTTVEREYLDMFFFSNLKSYKGAFT